MFPWMSNLKLMPAGLGNGEEVAELAASIIVEKEGSIGFDMSWWYVCVCDCVNRQGSLQVID